MSLLRHHYKWRSCVIISLLLPIITLAVSIIMPLLPIFTFITFYYVFEKGQLADEFIPYLPWLTQCSQDIVLTVVCVWRATRARERDRDSHGDVLRHIDATSPSLRHHEPSPPFLKIILFLPAYLRCRGHPIPVTEQTRMGRDVLCTGGQSPGNRYTDSSREPRSISDRQPAH